MTGTRGAAYVAAVSRDGTHRFSKQPVPAITLVAGMGVLGDAHAGTLVQHRSRVRRDPNQPNLRQVHLLACELFDEIRAAGHDVGPGALGENILTSGLDLLDLPTGTRLSVGEAVLEVTGSPFRMVRTRHSRRYEGGVRARHLSLDQMQVELGELREGLVDRHERHACSFVRGGSPLAAMTELRVISRSSPCCVTRQKRTEPKTSMASNRSTARV